MLSWILSSIICDTFSRDVGRNQAKNDEPQGLHIQFSTPTDYDKEEGNRYRELLIYADFNYVGVYTRTHWNVRKDGENSFHKGFSDWEVLSYHDSGWRDGVNRFVNTYENELISISGSHWYNKVPIYDNFREALAQARGLRKKLKV